MSSSEESAVDLMGLLIESVSDLDASYYELVAVIGPATIAN